MDYKGIKHADVTSEGLIVIFDDGREGILESEDVRNCLEEKDGFLKLQLLQHREETDD